MQASEVAPMPDDMSLCGSIQSPPNDNQQSVIWIF